MTYTNMEPQDDISRRKQQLKQEYEDLQRVYARLRTRYNRMVEYEGPQLKILYMGHIGSLEFIRLIRKRR